MHCRLPPSLSPAFAEAASRRQAGGGEGRSLRLATEVREPLVKKLNVSMLVHRSWIFHEIEA